MVVVHAAFTADHAPVSTPLCFVPSRGIPFAAAASITVRWGHGKCSFRFADPSVSISFTNVLSLTRGVRMFTTRLDRHHLGILLPRGVLWAWDARRQFFAPTWRPTTFLFLSDRYCIPRCFATRLRPDAGRSYDPPTLWPRGQTPGLVGRDIDGLGETSVLHGVLRLLQTGVSLPQRKPVSKIDICGGIPCNSSEEEVV